MSANTDRSEKIGLFPGTFDPVTRGHLDIAKRALLLCETLVMAVAHRHHKQTLFNIEERVALIEESLPGAIRDRITVKPFSGLLVNFAKEERVRVVVRGLRVISDFEYEFQMALMNKRLWPGIETVFLMPGEEFIYLNSTLVKEVARCHGQTDDFVTPNVGAALKARFAAPGSEPTR